MNALEKSLLLIYRAVWYLPAAFFVSLWLFFFVAWVKLGHSPVPGVNDPKDLGLDGMHVMTWYLLFAAYYGFFLCCLLLLVKLFVRSLPLQKWDVIVFAAGSVLATLMFLTDVMTWFLD